VKAAAPKGAAVFFVACHGRILSSIQGRIVSQINERANRKTKTKKSYTLSHESIVFLENVSNKAAWRIGLFRSG